MTNVTACGKFTKEGENTYRTSTYLQWGESEEIIGACVMCNPGSANKMESLLEFDKLIELNLDPTMLKLKDLLERFYKVNMLKGRFYIYNFFTLRESRMNVALERFNKLDEKAIMYRDYNDIQEKLEDIPWVLRAWGCEKGEKFINQRANWIQLISNKKFIGFQGKKRDTYWHPLQKTANRQKKLEENLLVEFDEKNLAALLMKTQEE